MFQLLQKSALFLPEEPKECSLISEIRLSCALLSLKIAHGRRTSDIYIYMYMYLYMYIYMYLYMYVCMDMYVYIRRKTFLYIFTSYILYTTFVQGRSEAQPYIYLSYKNSGPKYTKCALTSTSSTWVK